MKTTSEKINKKIDNADMKTLSRMEIVLDSIINKEIRCEFTTQEERIEVFSEANIYQYIDDVLLRV